MIDFDWSAVFFFKEDALESDSSFLATGTHMDYRGILPCVLTLDM